MAQKESETEGQISLEDKNDKHIHNLESSVSTLETEKTGLQIALQGAKKNASKAHYELKKTEERNKVNSWDVSANSDPNV